MTSSRKTLTMQDLAKAAGCSRAAASAVINGSKGSIRVSDDLRERVLRIAEELNYRPNHSSQALARGRTMTLGVYIDPLHGGGLAGQYHADILAGIEASAAAEGYDVLLVNFAGQTTFAQCIDKIARARIDGLLLLHAGRNVQLIDAMLEASSNVVAIDVLDPPPTLQAVLYDHDAAVRLAIEHFRQLGHRRIGYFGPYSTRPIAHNRARVEAFCRAMRQAGLTVDDDAVIFDERRPKGEPSEGHDRDMIGRFLSQSANRRPTAAVVYNDRLALTLLRACDEAGVAVPRDLSLINFENTTLCEATTPPLTCLDHPVYDISRRATDRLIKTIRAADAGADPPWHQVFAPSLISRRSTAAPSSRPEVSS
jgi:DNA-binding LacI/PurR family transcriptional regulator